MTNNQWSPAAVQFGESVLSPAALRNPPSAGLISRGACLPVASRTAALPADLPSALFTDLLTDLPAVPALFRTRLQLELLLQEPVVDVCAVTEVILADPGATIELFRLAGREWMPGEDRAERIEDALAGLPLAACLEVISGRAGCRGAGLPTLSAAWEHARTVALRMRVAAELEDHPHPEQAYLVGLLHELGSLPALLGWVVAAPSTAGLHAARGSRRRREQPCGAPGSLLAEEWRLPSFLVSALRDLEEARSPWTRLVAGAHDPERVQDAQAGWLPKHTHSAQVAPQRSRVLSFTPAERVLWKHGVAARPRVHAPMRPPA